MSISNYLENKVLDKALRNTDFTVTNAYSSLHTADPGETGASEVTGGAGPYARQLTAFDIAAAGATQNTAEEAFPGMPAVTVTHAGLWDAVSAGNFLWSGALTASKVVNAGDTFKFLLADIDVTLD